MIVIMGVSARPHTKFLLGASRRLGRARPSPGAEGGRNGDRELHLRTLHPHLRHEPVEEPGEDVERDLEGDERVWSRGEKRA